MNLKAISAPNIGCIQYPKQVGVQKKKKWSIQKVNTLGLIVKIIPGQEFFSKISLHHLFLLSGPAKIDSSFVSRFDYDFTYPPAKFLGCWDTQQHSLLGVGQTSKSWSVGTSWIHPFQSPKVHNIFKPTYTSANSPVSTFSYNCSSSKSSLPANPVFSERQMEGHKATRMQWCLSLQGKTPLFSW